MTRFSIIMATVNRVAEPRQFLFSLASQTHQNFELIVVDQNPDERLAPILAAHKDRFPILHLRLKTRGVSRARNAGLEHAAGDIVAFPDDDCLYSPDTLAEVSGFFSRNPDKDGLSGRSVDKAGHDSMAYFDPVSGPIDKLNVWSRGIEYTMFLRREALRDTRFDEEIGVASGTPWLCGEGSDYLLQLMKRGASLHYDPNLTVIHPATTFSEEARRTSKAYSYGCGMGYVLKKHEFPRRVKAKYVYRPVLGAALSLFNLDFLRARYYFDVFRGRLRGLL